MFKKIAAPLALLMMLGTCSMAGASALEPLPDEADDYLIRNTATGRYLTVANHDSLEGNAVVEYEADGIDSYNRWVRYGTEDGKFVFTSYDSALVLTINAEGVLTVAEREVGNISQQFTVEGNTFGIDAGGLALSPDASETNGALVRLGETNERSGWELIPITHNKYAKGDVNRDGVVDVFDLGLAKGLLLGTQKADIERIALANVSTENGNKLDVADIVLLTKYLHGTSALKMGTGNFTMNTIFPEVEIELPQPSAGGILKVNDDELPLGVELAELGEATELFSAGYTYGDVTFAVYAQQPEKMTVAIALADEIVGYYRICTDYEAPNGYDVAEYIDTIGTKDIYAILVTRSDITITSSYLTNPDDLARMSKLNFYAANGTRAINDLPVFEWDEIVAECALAHSADMAANNFFDHSSLDGSTPFDRLARYDLALMAVGENIHAGGSDPFYAQNRWYNSSVHRSNLLDPIFKKLGVGLVYVEDSEYGFYGTQNFVTTWD